MLWLRSARRVALIRWPLSYLFLSAALLALPAAAQTAAPRQVVSPTYAVRYSAAELLQPLRPARADLSQNLKLEKADAPAKVSNSYQLQTDKRLNCRYQATRVRFAARVRRLRGAT